MSYSTQGVERQRFRSFCERYLIARAEHFAKGREEEDAWECMQTARAIYNRLNGFSAPFDETGDTRGPEAQLATPNRP